MGARPAMGWILGWLVVGVGCSAGLAPLELERPRSADSGADALDGGHDADRRSGPDATRDAGRPDSGRRDAGHPDASQPDVGRPDAAPSALCTTPHLLGPPSGPRAAAAVTLGVREGPRGEAVLEAIWSDTSQIETATFVDQQLQRSRTTPLPGLHRLGRTAELAGRLVVLSAGPGAVIVSPGVIGPLVSMRTHAAGLSVDGALLRWVRRDEDNRRLWVETTDPQASPVALTNRFFDNELRDAWTRGDDAVAITWTDRVVSRRGGRSHTTTLAMEPWRLVEIGDSGVVVALGTVTSADGAQSGGAQVLGPGGRLVVLEGVDRLGEDQVDAVGFVHAGRSWLALAWNDNRGGPIRFAVLDVESLTQERLRLRDRVVPRTAQLASNRPSIVWDPRDQTLAVAWIEARDDTVQAWMQCGIGP